MSTFNKRIFALLGTLALAALSVTAIAAAPASAAAVPNDIPATAQFVDGQTHSIAAQGSLWYKFDYDATRDDSGHRTDATLAMVNATGTGLGFEVYTTDQIADWWEQKPVGRGTPQQIDEATGEPAEYGTAQSSDLTWVGNFVASGTYYVRVTNDNPTAMDFALTLQ